MSLAKHKYLLLVQSNKWNTPSPEEANLMELQAKNDQVEKQAWNAGQGQHQDKNRTRNKGDKEKDKEKTGQNQDSKKKNTCLDQIL